jgi:hypothetical protein
LVTAGNVTITNTRGGVSLNGVPGQISGTNLTVNAQNSVAVNTNVTNVSVNATGLGQSANVQQLRQLTGLNVVTNVGDITVNLAAGNLNHPTTNITAANANRTSFANVTLGAAAGNIAVGTITGNVLTVAALNQSSFITNVSHGAQRPRDRARWSAHEQRRDLDHCRQLRRWQP